MELEGLKFFSMAGVNRKEVLAHAASYSNGVINVDNACVGFGEVIQYEAVHAIPSWQALKQRLGPARLCYAFFHRGMPHEPLTFIQVALLKEIEWDVQRILNDPAPDFTDPHLCKTAIFYSISSSQKGLAGVDLGNFLIKRVVKEIQRDFPAVSTFCTLSPIPGFRSWLNTQFNLIESLLSIGGGDGRSAWNVLRDCLQTDEWQEKASKVSAFKPILLRLCSRYLLLEKKRSFALDPVANFHVRNGACVHRLNWLGDTSAKGMKQSYGIMVNYVYVLP
ncbi:malonyl-CoA decarboxylase, partial [Chytridium lagenaria]